MNLNLKYEEKEIDGLKFGTTQYAAMRGLELMGKLASSMGPALGAMSAIEGENDFEKYAPMLAIALRDLEPSKLSTLCVDILSGTTATIEENNKVKRVDLSSKEALDRVFSGRLMTMFKVILFALKVNFADFGFGSESAASESAPQEKTTEE